MVRAAPHSVKNNATFSTEMWRRLRNLRAALLAGRSRLLVLHLQLVNDLLDVWNARRQLFDHGPSCLRVDVSSERDNAVLDVVLHRFVKFVLNQQRMKILFDRFVEIGVDFLGDTFVAWRPYRNLVGDYLGSRYRFSDGFRLRLVCFRGASSSECYDAFVAILTDAHIFKIGLV